MRSWSVWLLTVPLILVMVAVATSMWLWKNFSTSWQEEKTAAQYVLNHTPIDHLSTYQVFTASGYEDVFKGTDSFHHDWYAFYIPSSGQVYSVEAANLIDVNKIETSLKKQHIHTQTWNIGYVTKEASTTIKSKANVVYELQGTTQGKQTFIYVDAKTGKVLWKYVL